ncbi:MAG TPA: hypothetical protein PKH77_13470 [Anaerolineae bacterium]|nr:hypothetical protein [Anaerolineae bacterium]
MAGFKTMNDWKTALFRMRGQIGEVTKKTVRDASLMARDAIRKRIPPAAEMSLFPGYAATGRMKSMIVGSNVRVVGGEYVARVGISQSAPRLEIQKIYVHEYGMIIRAKNGPYLVFQVQGRWVKVPFVTISAKRFVHHGWEDAQSRFPQLVFDQMSRATRS